MPFAKTCTPVAGTFGDLMGNEMVNRSVASSETMASRYACTVSNELFKAQQNCAFVISLRCLVGESLLSQAHCQL